MSLVEKFMSIRISLAISAFPVREILCSFTPITALVSIIFRESNVASNGRMADNRNESAYFTPPIVAFTSFDSSCKVPFKWL